MKINPQIFNNMYLGYCAAPSRSGYAGITRHHNGRAQVLETAGIENERVVTEVENVERI